MQYLAVTAAVALLFWLGYTLLRTWQTKKPDDPLRKGGDTTILPIAPLEGHAWENEEPRQLRPFKPIYHITMALQADTPQELITIDNEYLDRITLRRSLMAQHGKIVYGCTPHGVAALRELYSYLLADYLPRRYPSVFHLEQGNIHLHNVVTGNTHATIAPEDPDSALQILGETVEEDLFLLRETASGHECTAVVCCFPSGFTPCEKLGKLLSEIHEPVPHFDKIAKSMERFFGKLEVGRSVKRMNWNVQTHDQLFNRKSHHIDGPKTDEDVDISKTFARIELQTLTRLPQTRAILFSFKTYMYPVQKLKDEGRGPDFADAVEGLGLGNAPGMGVYKGSTKWGRAVCEYLRS